MSNVEQNDTVNVEQVNVDTDTEQEDTSSEIREDDTLANHSDEIQRIYRDEFDGRGIEFPEHGLAMTIAELDELLDIAGDTSSDVGTLVNAPHSTLAKEGNGTSVVPARPNFPLPDVAHGFTSLEKANDAARDVQKLFGQATDLALSGMTKLSQWSLDIAATEKVNGGVPPTDFTLKGELFPDGWIKAVVKRYEETAMRIYLPHDYAKQVEAVKSKMEKEANQQIKRSTGGQYIRPAVDFAALILFNPDIPSKSGYYEAKALLSDGKASKIAKYGACFAISVDKSRTVEQYERDENGKLETFDQYSKRVREQYGENKCRVVLAMPRDVVTPARKAPQAERTMAIEYGAKISGDNILIRDNQLVPVTREQARACADEAFRNRLRNIEGKSERQQSDEEQRKAADAAKVAAEADGKVAIKAFADTVEKMVTHEEYPAEKVVGIFDAAAQILKNKALMRALLKSDKSLPDILADINMEMQEYQEDIHGDDGNSRKEAVNA